MQRSEMFMLSAIIAGGLLLIGCSGSGGSGTAASTDQLATSAAADTAAPTPVTVPAQAATPFVQTASGSALRIIAIFAHPDDGDSKMGGTAAKWAAMGHKVKFLSLTNGDAGHCTQGGGALGARRRAEAGEAGRRLGIEEYEVLDNHDGELLPTLPVRFQVIRAIRQWNADVVIGLRPNDYHPDHRYAGMLVQDAAYMVTVPNVCPDTPALRRNPVFFYMQDGFQRPNPFRLDVAVGVDDVMDRKLRALDAHVSQMYEWGPCRSESEDKVPKDPATRFAWFKANRTTRPLSPEMKAALQQWYGAAADGIQNAEGFELCEYGSRPDEQELRRLFPFHPKPQS